MNKKIAIIVVVGVVLLIGVIVWLRGGSSVSLPESLGGDRGAPFGASPQTVNSSGNTSSDNTTSGIQPSTSGVIPSTSAPSGTSGTSQPAGSDQTAAKKEATKLINQSSVTANEFNTMNNSAGQIDPNTSL